MVTKRTRGDLIFDCFNYLLLTALTLITLYPFVHVVAGSISGPGTLIGHPVSHHHAPFHGYGGGDDSVLWRGALECLV